MGLVFKGWERDGAIVRLASVRYDWFDDMFLLRWNAITMLYKMCEKGDCTGLPDVYHECFKDYVGRTGCMHLHMHTVHIIYR